MLVKEKKEAILRDADVQNDIYQPNKVGDEGIKPSARRTALPDSDGDKTDEPKKTTRTRL